MGGALARGCSRVGAERRRRPSSRSCGGESVAEASVQLERLASIELLRAVADDGGAGGEQELIAATRLDRGRVDRADRGQADRDHAQIAAGQAGITAGVDCGQIEFLFQLNL